MTWADLIPLVCGVAYRDEDPVGWCSVAPRESYAAISAAKTIPSLPGVSGRSYCLGYSP